MLRSNSDKFDCVLFWGTVARPPSINQIVNHMVIHGHDAQKLALIMLQDRELINKNFDKFDSQPTATYILT